MSTNSSDMHLFIDILFWEGKNILIYIIIACNLISITVTINKQKNLTNETFMQVKRMKTIKNY